MLETTYGLTEIPADQIVLAVGSRSDAQLSEAVKDQFPTTVIGDASLVGIALEGIDSAYALALAFAPPRLSTTRAKPNIQMRNDWNSLVPL